MTSPTDSPSTRCNTPSRPRRAPSATARTKRSSSRRFLHDVGKLISVPNHPRIAAEILSPYVRHEVYCMVAYHQDFQGRYYYEYLGMDPNLRDQHRGQPWYELAEQFR